MYEQVCGNCGGPRCGKCGEAMAPENATIRPELFLHDECLPEELNPMSRMNRNSAPPWMTRSQVQAVGEKQPKTWDDYEKGCIATYRGGHHDPKELAAFQHGMQTVFNLLRNEFPPAEEFARQHKELRYIRQIFQDIDEFGEPQPQETEMPDLAARILTLWVNAKFGRQNSRLWEMLDDIERECSSIDGADATLNKIKDRIQELRGELDPRKHQRN